MSTALLKKSIELVETDYTSKVFEKAGSSEQYSQIKLLNKPKKQKELRGVSDVKKKSLKIVEKVRKKTKNRKEKLTENLKKLKLLYRFSVDEKIVNTILEDSKKPGTDRVAKVEEQKTAFTEEDFINFEKEYFGN